MSLHKIAEALMNLDPKIAETIVNNLKDVINH